MKHAGQHCGVCLSQRWGTSHIKQTHSKYKLDQRIILSSKYLNTKQDSLFCLWSTSQREAAVSLVVKASPVPAGAVQAWSYEQDDQQGDEQAEADDGGSHGPHQRPLGHVNQGWVEGHPHPARPPAVLRGVPGQVDALHAQRADHARPLVAQLVKGVFTMVAAHTTLTWRGQEVHSHVFWNGKLQFQSSRIWYKKNVWHQYTLFTQHYHSACSTSNQDRLKIQSDFSGHT